MINFNSAYAEENKIFLTPNNTKIIAIMDFENNTGKERKKRTSIEIKLVIFIYLRMDCYTTTNEWFS